MSLLGLSSWGLSERNVPFTCFCSECCMQRGPGRSVSWVYAEGIKWGTIHTLPPKMPRALLWGAEESKEKQRGEKMKGWIPGSHMKVEGHCACAWTELHKEWGKALSLLTEILSVTWTEAVFFVLFLLWCQLQCQPQHPTVASATSSGLFLWPTPMTGTSAGPLATTKQMMEISHSGTKDLKETCSWVPSQFPWQTNTVIQEFL